MREVGCTKLGHYPTSQKIAHRYIIPATCPVLKTGTSMYSVFVQFNLLSLRMRRMSVLSVYMSPK
jgi:hypothetical protein